MTSPYFQRFDPIGQETPVVVEVPHAGLGVPAPFLAPLAAPARALGRDADLYVDELYADAPLEGATLLVARTSRYVIDLNRAETDIDSGVVEGGPSGARLAHGLVWRTTGDGDPALGRPLTRAELEERLSLVYWPYHRALRAELERKRNKFGLAVLLAAHSMPSTARGAAASHAAPIYRADVVPGSRGHTSAHARFIDAVEVHARARGWTVRHDEPYAGGFSTQFYGRPVDAIHAVQVEISRRLYLDEGTLRPRPELGEVRAWCRELVARLARLASGG
jgi:N-formylglutamate amidohydrolase